MNIGKVRVHVSESRVNMPMIVGLLGIRTRLALMLVVLIMRMRMAMLAALVMVLVFLVFRKVQPYAPAHQGGGNPEPGARGFSNECNRD